MIFAMTILIDTLAKAARHRMLVVAECRRCHRKAQFLASDLANFYNPGRDLRTLPFKCRECDVMDCKISPIEYLNDRTREVVVWRPVKVKE